MNDPNSVRDGFIVCKALAYAIAAIVQLPERQQEKSDMRDMRRLLDHLCSSQATLDTEFYINNALRHLSGEGFNEDNKKR